MNEKENKNTEQNQLKKVNTFGYLLLSQEDESIIKSIELSKNEKYYRDQDDDFIKSCKCPALVHGYKPVVFNALFI